MAQPNIVLIQTNIRYNIVDYMPQLATVLAGSGCRFLSAYTTTSLLGPARVNLTTGQLASEHGFISHHEVDAIVPIYDNNPTLATRLKDVGYYTACIGGFPGYGYSVLGPPTLAEWYIPPGWDKWWVLANDPILAFLNYKIVKGVSTTEDFGSADEDFLIDVMAQEACDWIDARHGANETPWYLHMCVPNGGVPTRYLDMYGDVPPNRAVSFNEADTTDKDAGIQALPDIDDTYLDGIRAGQLRALCAIDDLFRAIYDCVQTHDPANTVIAVVGQGSMFWGEHKLGPHETLPGDPSPWHLFATNMPYEEANRVPLIIIYPPEYQPNTSETRLTTTQDLTATLAFWAGAASNGLTGELFAKARFKDRKSLVLEGWQSDGEPFYTGVRTRSTKTFTWYTDKTETYDLVNDPFEMESST